MDEMKKPLKQHLDHYELLFTESISLRASCSFLSLQSIYRCLFIAVVKKGLLLIHIQYSKKPELFPYIVNLMYNKIIQY